MRTTFRVAVATLLTVALVHGVAVATTDRYGASRAIAWFEADTGDIHRFPARTIRAGPDVLELEEGAPFDLAAASGMADPEAFLAETGTAAFLVVQDQRIRYEHYVGDAGPDQLRTSFSAAKSVLSTLVGLAIEDGHIDSLDDPVTDYVPELLQRDQRFGRITLRHLLTMSSGLAYTERSLPWSDDAQTYYSPDLRSTALSARVAGPPGEEFLYNNFNPLLEGLVLERATGMSVAAYLEERLWVPMGAEADASWSLDSERSGFEKMESGFNAVARDYARFGMLFAHEGRAGSRQVLPASWVELATSTGSQAGPSDLYALHWWTGTFGGDRFPGGHALAAGNHGQYVYVAPDRDVVIVRLGDDQGTDDWPALLARIAAAS